MAENPSTDPTFIYHNTYENKIFNSNTTPAPTAPTKSTEPTAANMSWQDQVANDPSLQSFTATGRPIPHPKASAQGREWNSMFVADALGQGAPNLLPVKHTDDSIISIPVLPPQDSSEVKLADSDEEEEGNPVKSKPKGRMSFFRRKLSSSSKKDKKTAFVMKDVKRGDYLKYYAKDEKGNYIGTSDPAPDCILNNESDRMKYRKAFAFREALAAPPMPVMTVSNQRSEREIAERTKVQMLMYSGGGACG